MSENPSSRDQGSKKPDFMVELIKKLQLLATSELPKQYETQWAKLLEGLEGENWGDRISELLPQGLAIALAHWFVGQSLGAKETPSTLKGKSKTSELEFAIEVDPIRVDYSPVLNKQLVQDKRPRSSSYVDPIRAAFLETHGLPIPAVVEASNTALQDDEYMVSFDGIEVFRGRLFPGKMLMVAPYAAIERLQLLDELIEDLGPPACWVPLHFLEEFDGPASGEPSHGSSLELLVDPLADSFGENPTVLRFLTPRQVVSQVLAVQCARHARLLCSRSTIIDRLQRLRGPKQQLVEELRRVGGISLLHRVAQRLLEERVSIRPLGTILGSLLDHLPSTTDVKQLSHLIRRDLGRHLTRHLERPSEKLPCYRLAPELTHELRRRVADGASSREALPSALAEALSTQLQSLAQKRWRSNKPVVFVVDPEIRRVFFELALQRVADPHVLAFDEIAPEVELVELETISWDAPAPPSSNDILDTRR